MHKEINFFVSIPQTEKPFILLEPFYREKKTGGTIYTVTGSYGGIGTLGKKPGFVPPETLMTPI